MPITLKMEFKDRFYKSTEVAEILGVSLRTLYRYMDSGKIQSVQIPSGRHRFTKQQIEDFLYSSGTPSLGPELHNNSFSHNKTGLSPQKFEPNADKDKNLSTSSLQVANKPKFEKKLDTEDDIEKELDALLKELDSDFSSEDIVEDPEKNLPDIEVNLDHPEEQKQEPINKVPLTASSILEESYSDKKEEFQKMPPELNENVIHYFYCPFNELRTIARMVKSLADENRKEYAFTMNAGLSLFFPLEPFSVIHFYVKDSDLDFWKENLQLKDSATSDANLGILLTKVDAFKNLKEVSGLKVVSKEILKKNFEFCGNPDLAKQADEKL